MQSPARIGCPSPLYPQFRIRIDRHRQALFEFTVIAVASHSPDCHCPPSTSVATNRNPDAAASISCDSSIAAAQPARPRPAPPTSSPRDCAAAVPELRRRLRNIARSCLDPTASVSHRTRRSRPTVRAADDPRSRNRKTDNHGIRPYRAKALLHSSPGTPAERALG